MHCCNKGTGLGRVLLRQALLVGERLTDDVQFGLVHVGVDGAGLASGVTQAIQAFDDDLRYQVEVAVILGFEAGDLRVEDLLVQPVARLVQFGVLFPCQPPEDAQQDQDDSEGEPGTDNLGQSGKYAKQQHESEDGPQARKECEGLEDEREANSLRVQLLLGGDVVKSVVRGCFVLRCNCHCFLRLVEAEYIKGQSNQKDL